VLLYRSQGEKKKKMGMADENITQNLQVLNDLAECVRAALIELYPCPFPARGSFFSRNYNGACAVASYMLAQVATRFYGIHLKVVTAEYHTWCESEDGTIIVDATYSQFNKTKPVWIGARGNRHTFGRSNVGEPCSLEDYPECQDPMSNYHNDTIQRWLNDFNPDVLKNHENRKKAA